LFYSKLSENYEKMTLKTNFGNREKLVPTQKPTQMFGLKFGMQGLIWHDVHKGLHKNRKS